MNVKRLDELIESLEKEALKVENKNYNHKTISEIISEIESEVEKTTIRNAFEFQKASYYLEVLNNVNNILKNHDLPYYYHREKRKIVKTSFELYKKIKNKDYEKNKNNFWKFW
jgi:hypothetical protein